MVINTQTIKDGLQELVDTNDLTIRVFFHSNESGEDIERLFIEPDQEKLEAQAKIREYSGVPSATKIPPGRLVEEYGLDINDNPKIMISDDTKKTVGLYAKTMEYGEKMIISREGDLLRITREGPPQ